MAETDVWWGSVRPVQSWEITQLDPSLAGNQCGRIYLIIKTACWHLRGFHRKRFTRFRVQAELPTLQNRSWPLGYIFPRWRITPPVADGRPSSSRKRINWKGRGPRSSRGECSVLRLGILAAEAGGPRPGLWLTPRTNQKVVLKHGCWGFLPSSPGACIARLAWVGQCRGDRESSLGIWVPGSLLSALLCSVPTLPLCRGTTQGPTPSTSSQSSGKSRPMTTNT